MFRFYEVNNTAARWQFCNLDKITPFSGVHAMHCLKSDGSLPKLHRGSLFRHLAQLTPLSVELHAACLSQVRSDFINLSGLSVTLNNTDSKFPCRTDEVASLGSSHSVGGTALLQVTPSVLVQE